MLHQGTKKEAKPSPSKMHPQCTHYLIKAHFVFAPPAPSITHNYLTSRRFNVVSHNQPICISRLGGSTTMQLLASELSSEIERKIFTGDSSVNADDFDGAVKVLTGSTEAIKVAGVAITKGNVLGEVEKVFNLVPTNVVIRGIEEGTLNIFVSYATYLKAKMALGGVYGQNVMVSPNYTVEGDVLRYMGIEIVPVKGLSDKEMIAVDSKNFVLGTDLVSDLEEIRLGQFAAPHNNKIFIDGRLRLGFVIPFENEVVYYK